MTLVDLFQGRLSPADLEVKQQQLREMAEEEGLVFGIRNMTYNSRLAQELAKWADTTLEDSEKLHSALYRGYFGEGKNIGNLDVLLELTEESGLSVDDAKTVLEKRQFKEAVDQDWATAYQYQVTGVPTFLASQYIMVGAQPYDQLARLVEHVGTPLKE